MPDPTLQATALRYAAGDLAAVEAAAFEARLATDQDARDALSEAVRLSAAALGQQPPTPHRSFRALIRERLAGWRPVWLARRAYRGHPLAWLALGATTVAACTVFALSVAHEDAGPLPFAQPTTAATPAPPSPLAPVPVPPDADAAQPIAAAPPGDDDDGQSVAEIWAQLSTTDQLEKAHDDEMRWRQKLRDAGTLHPGRLTATDSRDP